MADYLLDQTGAEVQEILDAVQNPDTTPVAGSTNLITSGGVQAAIAEVGSKSNQQVAENGWFLVDENLNIGLKYDSDGLDAAKVSKHFTGLLGGMFAEVAESGFYVVDTNLNIGVIVNNSGVHAKNTIEYEFIN